MAAGPEAREALEPVSEVKAHNDIRNKLELTARFWVTDSSLTQLLPS